MKSWIIRFFGLRGSWSWACRQMENGRIVRQRSATGSVRYKLDHEGQRRIMWTHAGKDMGSVVLYENANIFLSDFEATDWIIYGDTNDKK